MRRLLLGAALVASCSLTLGGQVLAHGGTYIGPGDTVPPAGGGGGGGGGAPSAGGPSIPGPTGPSGPGSTTPGSVPRPGAGPVGPTTSAGETAPDLTLWQYWWGFNQAPYLRLRDAIHRRVVTGSDDFYLGQGEKAAARGNLAPSPAVIRGTIVPALRAALRSERANDILDACLIALARIGDSETEDGSEPLAGDIKRFLSHSSQQVAETAAVSLGILANDSAENVGILLALFEDRPEELRSRHGVRLNGAVGDRTRAFAGYGLGLIGSRAGDETRLGINAALVRLLDGEGKRMGTRDVQVAAVVSMGLTPLPLDPTAAEPELRQAETASGWPKPEQVTSRQEQVAFLMNYFEDTEANNFLIAAHAPTAVARLVRELPPDHALRGMVARRFLQDTTRHSKAAREIQQSCVQALGLVGDCDEDPIDVEIRSALMEVGKELADPQARLFALIALGQACGRPGRGAGDRLAGLAGGKDSPRAYLMTQLARSRSGMRPWAALGLAILERSLDDAGAGASKDSLAALREALRDARSPDEVGGYAIALGIARDPAAGPLLLEQLERTSTAEARGYCAVGLGMLDHAAARDRITELIERSKYQPDLLRSAAIGLGLLGDDSLVPRLVGMLEQASGLSSQAAIASALGFIGDHRSVDPLIALLEDQEKTAGARGFAAAALGLVADKEALPWNARVGVDINYRANTTTLTSPETGDGLLDLL